MKRRPPWKGWKNDQARPLCKWDPATPYVSGMINKEMNMAARVKIHELSASPRTEKSYSSARSEKQKAMNTRNAPKATFCDQSLNHISCNMAVCALSSSSMIAATASCKKYPRNVSKRGRGGFSALSGCAVRAARSFNDRWEQC